MPIELRGTSFQTVDRLFGSRLCLSEVTFVLGMPSYVVTTLTDLVVH